MALPCEKTCERFHPGCHKSCARWKSRQQAEARRREQVKSYLRDARELYVCLERQWYQTALHW